MMEEPSILDYLKAKLTPWRGPAPPIPPLDLSEQIVRELEPEIKLQEKVKPSTALRSEELVLTTSKPAIKLAAWTWRSLIALGLALMAQLSLEPGPGRTWTVGAVLYLLAFAGLIWASWRGDWLAASNPQTEARVEPLTVRLNMLLVGTTLALFAFLAFGGNSFNLLNLVLWIFAVGFIIHGFWLPGSHLQHRLMRLRSFLLQRSWKITITGWTLLLFATAILVVFFRVYRLNQVPPEMVSDHAEKLLDVWDVLNGQPRIFFPRNTGREALQMYLTTVLIKVFGTGYSFLSLKIGTAIAGLLTLPFIYLLGKEIGNRRIGLLATVFCGIAYWPNVISRIGLRFPLYPLFVAPTIYYLLRGLRTSKRNDFILAGIFGGIGLHGYTSFRIVPFVIIAAVGLFLIHRQSIGYRRQAIIGFFVLSFVSLMVFLPLLRYAIDNPEIFSYRLLSRLGTVERMLPGPAWQIFWGNLWDAVTMFAWDDGEIWVHSVTHRPALDFISSALFYIGVVLLFVRYLRRRHWQDLFLLIAVPLLMMPSILSLAFPAENPALNRMAGAIVPVFLIIGLALDGLMNVLESRLSSQWGKGVAWGLIVLLLSISSLQNYNLVFQEYQRVYERSSWNTSEMGQVIHDYANSIGTPDSAWVVAYPYWVDTRLVGMNAGYPLKDYAILPENFTEIQTDSQAKLFLIKPDDTASVEALRRLFPLGVLQNYVSQIENHDFLIFFVPSG